MRSVDVKQLQARLSEYLRLAGRGEVVQVTDRDEVVAELGPPRRQAGESNPLEATLERLVLRGDVTRASETKSGWSWSPPHLGLSAETASDLLEDERLREAAENL